MVLLLPAYPVNFQEAAPVQKFGLHSSISNRIQQTGKSGKLRKTGGSCLGCVPTGPCFSAVFWISLLVEMPGYLMNVC